MRDGDPKKGSETWGGWEQSPRRGGGGDRAPEGVDRDSKKGNKQGPGALMIKSPGFVLKP